MNGQDLFIWAMWAVGFGIAAWFAVEYWLDERRKKREAAANDPFARFTEAMRQFRIHR